jgi:FKBP-type peptidyl-prolyl cis-trans isomerase SlyD
MKITKNILVHIDYTLKDEDGFHLNPDEGELIYLHGGYGHVFASLEARLEGKEAGDSFKVTLASDEAFGDYKDELVVLESLEALPEDIFIGMELESFDEESGETLIYVVSTLEGQNALLNANHPLAGKTLTFEGVITELEELTQEGVNEILEHDAHHHHEH